MAKTIQEHIEFLAYRVERWGNKLLSVEAVSAWPQGRLEELLSLGVVIPSDQSADKVPCDTCDEHCLIEPDIVEYPNGKRVGLFYCRIQCERIEVNTDRFRLWEIVPETCKKYLLSQEEPKEEPKLEPVLSKPVEPMADSETEEKLPTRAEAAYQSYLHAVAQLGKQVYDKIAYDYIVEHPFEEYDLPAFLTWRRYLTQARKFYDQRKNTRVAGRVGRSIVRADQL